MPTIVNAMTLGMKNCTGVRSAAGRISQPDEPQCARGIATVEAVVVLPDEGQHEQHADAADGAEHAPVEGVGAVVVLHEEVGEHREGEQPEAHAPRTRR